MEIAIIVSALTLIISIAGVFFWNIAETRSIANHLEGKFGQLETKIDNLIAAIHAESKDFHGRLSVIEDRHKK